jgi:uncharacterized protein YciI
MPLYVRTVLITAIPKEAAPVAARHLDQLRSLRAEGRLRAAGAFREGGGYLEIFEAKDRLEAEAIARSSPLVEEGLATWHLREWEEIEI